MPFLSCISITAVSEHRERLKMKGNETVLSLGRCGVTHLMH